MTLSKHVRRLSMLLLLAMALCTSQASTPEPSITLNATAAQPRALEPSLQQSIRRDYLRAWESVSAALQSGDPALLDQYWVGVAHDKLQRLIADQARTGIRLQFVDRSHQLQAVFYPKDGATLLLHDTASGELQVLDSGKVVHAEAVTQKYVVLMTPGADRWYIRVLQSVPGF
jgi:hypothetical protein